MSYFAPLPSPLRLQRAVGSGSLSLLTQSVCRSRYLWCRTKRPMSDAPFCVLTAFSVPEAQARV